MGKLKNKQLEEIYPEHSVWPRELDRDVYLQTGDVEKAIHAKKFDNGKAPMNLLDGKFLEEVAHVLGFGAQKYGMWNFKNGHQLSRLISAALRHITQFNEGQDLDEETKRSHLAHATCCLMFAFYNLNNKPENDDRWKG